MIYFPFVKNTKMQLKSNYLAFVVHHTNIFPVSRLYLQVTIKIKTLYIT